MVFGSNSDPAHFSTMSTTSGDEPPVPPKPKRQITKRTGTVRRRTGCLTCRARRKKCDEMYPICGHCTRLNLVCKREDPRAIVKQDKLQTTEEIPFNTASSSVADMPRNMMVPKLPHPMDIHQILDARQAGNNRFFMKYYVQILTNLLTTNLENNSFLSIFIPMSMDSEPVLAALMAWSSMHLSRFDSSYTVPALEYRSTALNAVASALVPSSPAITSDPESILAAALILCSIEIAAGDTTGRWYDHMLGARFIIQSARTSGPNGRLLQGAEFFKRTMDGQWLLSDFAYHDVLGSVALGEPPLLKGPYWRTNDPATVDSYAGVATRILELISEISCLPKRPYESIESPPSDSGSVTESMTPSSFSTPSPPDTSKIVSAEHEFSNRARFLEKALKDWKPPEVENRYVKDLALSYRSSALIYLYRKVRVFAPALTDIVNQKIATCVNETVKYIKDIPVSSLPECGIPFPLFMAGGDTMDPDHTRYIAERLENLLKHRGFGNIQSILDVLEELWRLKSAGQRGPTGAPVDWMDVLKAKDWKLALF